MGEKTPYGYKHGDGHYSKATGHGDKASYSIYNKNPSSPNHESIHINYNTKTGKGNIVESNGSGGKTTTGIGCYLTTACMKHFKDHFDDNCYELTVLRWFRDNFVSQEDIEHYYKTAPIIVEGIDTTENNDIIYDYIYDNVVDACVNAIEQGDYEFAYNRYKSSILSFEETFARPLLEEKIVKTLQKTL